VFLSFTSDMGYGGVASLIGPSCRQSLLLELSLPGSVHKHPTHRQAMGGACVVAYVSLVAFGMGEQMSEQRARTRPKPGVASCPTIPTRPLLRCWWSGPGVG